MIQFVFVCLFVFYNETKISILEIDSFHFSHSVSTFNNTTALEALKMVKILQSNSLSLRVCDDGSGKVTFH